jgi:signal transduction histidine kinase
MRRVESNLLALSLRSALFQGHRRMKIAFLGSLACLAVGSATAQEAPEKIHGLPFTRFYSFEEIGNSARGSRLSFDAHGRLAVVHAGEYMVLNDTTWIDLADKDLNGPEMQRVVFGPDGNAYYGAFGSWGRVEITPEGMLRPHSMLPASYPNWVMASNFTDIVFTGDGVYFGGFNGIAFWDRKADRHVFFEAPQLSRIFAIGDKVFASLRVGGIHSLDVKNGTLHPVTETDLSNAYIDQVTPLGRERVLMSTINGDLVTFDGRNTTVWPKSPGDRPAGRVSSLQTLVDGSVAVAISGKGLYFFSEQGEIRHSLTTPEYHRITDLAAREPGVLWISNENGVEKMLYQNPLTVFGQRLGLPISWPQVVQWKDQVVVASGGRLYESIPSTAGEATRFELVNGQPEAELWGIAAQGSQMLVGNQNGVFVRDQTGKFSTVLTGINVARLVMVDPTLCYVIGSSEITALRWSDGHWSECASRIPGLGYPAVTHAAKRSAWIELGANRAARVILKNDKLEARIFDKFPWPVARWTNIGIVGDTVVLSGLPGGRVFFDENTETLVESPKLQQLLERAPHPIARAKQDEQGTIWGSHDQGLVLISPQREGYQVDRTAFGRINDHFPVIQLLPASGVWLSTSQSLYHVDRNLGREPASPFKPVLVSATDGRTNRVVFKEENGGENTIPPLKYAQNSLSFRFFAGSYASYKSPSYEFKLNRGTNSWTPLGNGSLLTLTDLREGTYRLDVRITNPLGAIHDSLSLEFQIAPPWYRTWQAYACYFLFSTAAILALMRWSAHRSRKQNLILEKLVQERTEALRVTMQRLNEETRNAATLAERDRLAGEIHDSLQQGLSGLMLQLDATLKLPDLSIDVRSRLGIARNMVSFTRHEVQHAVWDMETPLLDGTELGDALRKISALIGPGTARVEVSVTGQQTPLSPATKHHLLRIAQEAITNSVRHAAAKTITISLSYLPSGVSLTVADDGNGFVPNDVLNNGIGHFGLRGLRGRANKIDGELQVQSAPGTGTSVRVTVRTSVPAYSHANDR